MSTIVTAEFADDIADTAAPWPRPTPRHPPP